LEILTRIADTKDHPARNEALRDIGLFGEAAVPYLTGALKNSQTKDRAIRGLGETACSAAVSDPY
jgi:hypothetical protein